MAKAPIPKKKKKGPSLRSRAARRASSPSINTDRSLKEIGLPSGPTTGAAPPLPSVLAARRDAGVCKNRKAPRLTLRDLSSRARRRHDRSAEMALAVMERTAAKVEDSKARSRTTQARGRAWDEVNRRRPGGGGGKEKGVKVGEGKVGFAVLDVDGDEEGDVAGEGGRSGEGEGEGEGEDATVRVRGGAEGGDDVDREVAAIASAIDTFTVGGVGPPTQSPTPLPQWVGSGEGDEIL